MSSFLRQSQNENADPRMITGLPKASSGLSLGFSQGTTTAFGQAKEKEGLVQKAKRAVVRTALGDISNRIKAKDDSKLTKDGDKVTQKTKIDATDLGPQAKAVKVSVASKSQGAIPMEITKPAQLPAKPVAAVAPRPVAPAPAAPAAPTALVSRTGLVREKPAPEMVLLDDEKLTISRLAVEKQLQSMDEADVSTEMDIVEDFTMGDQAGFDVDSADSGDPLACSEWIGDIMAYFRRAEVRRAPSANYMAKQTDINPKMREILIDWLVEVHLNFKLHQETLYLTVNIIDRFLERRAVRRTKLQLVGCTAMLIASKYEEIYAPEVKDLVYISDKAYSHEQILAMESIMLNTLKFNLTVPSALRFAERFLKVFGANDNVTSITLFLAELQLQKYQFLRYLPSMIASAALYMAIRTVGGTWDQKMVAHTQYSEAALESCVRDYAAIINQKAPRYCAVRKKFSHPKYFGVAKGPIWTHDGFVTPTM